MSNIISSRSTNILELYSPPPLSDVYQKTAQNHIEKLKKLRSEYDAYHSGTATNISTKKQKAFKTVRLANRLSSLRFEKYLPTKHQRAGKIARWGALTLAATGPTIHKAAGSAGSWSTLPSEEKQAVGRSFTDVVKDPNVRSLAWDAAKKAVTTDVAAKVVGGYVKHAAVATAAPIVPAYKSIKKLVTGKEDEKPTLNPGEQKEIQKIKSSLSHHTGGHSNELTSRLEIDPLVGGLYSKAQKHLARALDVGKDVYSRTASSSPNSENEKTNRAMKVAKTFSSNLSSDT